MITDSSEIYQINHGDGCESEAKRRKRSLILEYFSRSSHVGLIKVICLSCPRSFSKSSGTSTLILHAKSHGHFLEYLQSTLTSQLQLGKCIPKPAQFLQENARRQLVQWSFHLCSSFSTLEDVEFRSFSTIFHSSFKPLSRMTVQRHIHKERDDLRLIFKELLRKLPGKLSLTTESWSLRLYRGYSVVTGHLMD